MANNVVTLIPDRATLLEAAQMAAASHLHLITDGRDVVLSPMIPPGWHKMGAVVRQPAERRAA